MFGLDYLTAIAWLLFSAGLAGIVVGLRRWFIGKGSVIFWASVIWTIFTIVLLLWLRTPAPAY
jgi:hypothetical protein